MFAESDCSSIGNLPTSLPDYAIGRVLCRGFEIRFMYALVKRKAIREIIGLVV
jgi:hypothetical protein